MMERKRSDIELVEACRNGCTASFEEIINRYSPKAYNLAFRLTRSQDDAEEVLQDVFVTVHRKLGAFEGKSSFSSWLYRVTVNTALMKLRKRRQDRSVLLEDAVPDFEHTQFARGPESIEGEYRSMRKELLMALEAAIDELPAEYRPVFILRDIDGLTSKEVGKVLNISIPAVKSRLHRSRMLLRKRLLGFYRESRGIFVERAIPRAANS